MASVMDRIIAEIENREGGLIRLILVAGHMYQLEVSALSIAYDSRLGLRYLRDVRVIDGPAEFLERLPPDRCVDVRPFKSGTGNNARQDYLDLGPNWRTFRITEFNVGGQAVAA